MQRINLKGIPENIMLWRKMIMDCNVNNENKPLPDILSMNLKVLFIGYNPGILSAKNGHHYSHRSNRFWRLLYESGLTPNKFKPEEDRNLLDLNFGSTNIVDRPSKAADEIGSLEVIDGAKCLYRLIMEIKPQIACYVGIGVYRAFASSILEVLPASIQVKTGKQQNRICEYTLDFVCSSTSGLNTIPYTEQLKCFQELKALIDGV